MTKYIILMLTLIAFIVVLTTGCGGGYEAPTTPATAVDIYLVDTLLSDETTHNLNVGDYTLTAKITPLDYDSTINWRSSNENVATINKTTGALNCIKPGITTIYVDVKGATKIITAKFILNVNTPPT